MQSYKCTEEEEKKVKEKEEGKIFATTEGRDYPQKPRLYEREEVRLLPILPLLLCPSGKRSCARGSLEDTITGGMVGGSI